MGALVLGGTSLALEETAHDQGMHDASLGLLVGAVASW